MFELEGAIHIHTSYSDGSGSVSEISKAASEVGIDFIIITDHNTLKAKIDGYEGWNNDVLVIIGYELNDKDDKNHYVVFGVDSLPKEPYEPKDYVEFVKEKGGLGFIAHPNEKRVSLERHPAYPWTAWDIDGFTGMEIWNHMSEWIEGLKDDSKFHRLFHPLKSIIGPTKVDLKMWDKLNKSRPVIGIGSVDAHAFKQDIMGFFNVEIFPYKVLFKSIRTHVLITGGLGERKNKNLEKQKKEIYNALRKGHCFIANYYHGDGKGFRFLAEHSNKKYIMGDSLEITRGDTVILQVLCPLEGNINLLRNGENILNTNGLEMIYDCKDPGIYRIEVYREDKGWIFSNHIRINRKK